MATWGYTLSINSGGGAQNLLSGTSPFEGPVIATIRVDDPGVFIGGYNVAGSLPGTGFELVPGKDYEFPFLVRELFAATTSTTNVPIRVFVTPKI